MVDYFLDPQIIRIERNRTVVVDARQQLTSYRSTRQRRAATRESFARKSFQFEELCTLPQRGGQRERERGVVNPAAGERRWIESSSTAVKRHVVYLRGGDRFPR